jgi:hypothetical protein
MIRVILFLFVMTISFNVFTQGVKKVKSYSYYGALELEDNSFLIEEAFNQKMGVIQHTSSLVLDKIHYETAQLSFTQEIPITNKTHQLSYSLCYSMHPQVIIDHGQTNGFGDLSISYRPLLLDENDWLMMIPRFTLILPTGNSSHGLGAGGVGVQFNMALTRRISKKLVTHYNFGATQYFNYNHYVTSNDKPTLNYEKNLLFGNVGASVIWHASNRFNIMAEWVSKFEKKISDEGVIVSTNYHLINPGVRYAFEVGHMQIVPGIGVPFNIGSNDLRPGVFFYISVESK